MPWRRCCIRSGTRNAISTCGGLRGTLLKRDVHDYAYFLYIAEPACGDTSVSGTGAGDIGASGTAFATVFLQARKSSSSASILSNRTRSSRFSVRSCLTGCAARALDVFDGAAGGVYRKLEVQADCGCATGGCEGPGESADHAASALAANPPHASPKKKHLRQKVRLGAEGGGRGR